MTKVNIKKIVFSVMPVLLAVASFVIASGADNSWG